MARLAGLRTGGVAVRVPRNGQNEQKERTRAKRGEPSQHRSRSALPVVSALCRNARSAVSRGSIQGAPLPRPIPRDRRLQLPGLRAPERGEWYREDLPPRVEPDVRRLRDLAHDPPVAP